MGGHGHGHEPPYTVPHHSTFQVKGCKELEELENALARHNLKDPWIRNEVWRFHPGFGTKLQRARNFFFRGFPLGLALTVAVVAADKMFFGGDDHGHGHGHGHGHDCE